MLNTAIQENLRDLHGIIYTENIKYTLRLGLKVKNQIEDFEKLE